MLSDPLPVVRGTVRELLLASPGYVSLSPEEQRALAQNMVRVCHAAALLIREEAENQSAARVPPLARAQEAQPPFGGAAAQVGGITQNVLNAVSFPRFVTELINGVFKAMIDSSTQQMHSYVDLLNNVAASLDGFEQANVGPVRARQWLAERYPDALEIVTDDASGDGSGPTLQLKDGARFPTEARLRTDLGLDATDSAPTSGDPERSLVPLARGYLARQRQAMLSTMVQMGMQRIVVESGRIQAAMHFHIDTRDQATHDSGNTFDFRNTTGGGASFGVGNWGLSANMTNTVGYVTTDKQQTSAAINTDLDLTSSVEINFKSDYLPLNRLATADQAQRIQAHSLNPAAEADAARATRTTSQAADEASRREATRAAIAPPSQPAALPADLPASQRGTISAAEQARQDAAHRSQAGAASGAA